VTIYLSPSEKASPKAEMAKWATGVFVLELALVGWARRRKRNAK